MLTPNPDRGLGDVLPDPTWWPDHTLIPYEDAASRHILARALTCLILVRGGNLDDPGATISSLVSLIASAQARLDDAVADARDHRFTWNRIAERLGTSIPTARHRFADYVRYRRELRSFL